MRGDPLNGARPVVTSRGESMMLDPDTVITGVGDEVGGGIPCVLAWVRTAVPVAPVGDQTRDIHHRAHLWPVLPIPFVVIRDRGVLCMHGMIGTLSSRTQEFGFTGMVPAKEAMAAKR